jgi:bisphosphoglycerate-independent phosphoglycerate mutase (AlkP superfamily)
LTEAWDDEHGLLVITSDHGNMEDLGTRRHTANPVPGILLGSPENRRLAARGLNDLTGIAPAIVEFLGNNSTTPGDANV